MVSPIRTERRLPGATENKRLSQIANVLYLCCLAVYVTNSFVNYGRLDYSDSLGPLFLALTGILTSPLMFVALLCVLVIDLYCTGINKRKLAIGIIGIAIAVANQAIYPEEQFTRIVAFVVAYPSSLRWDKAFDFTCLLGTGLAILTLACGIVGDIPDLSTFEHSVLRRAFGYLNPNALALMASTLVMLWLYRCSAHWKPWHSLVALLLQATIYAFSNGRVSVLLGLLHILATTYYCMPQTGPRLKALLRNIVYWAATWLFPIFATATLLVTPVFARHSESQVFVRINQLLANRPLGWVVAYSSTGYHSRGHYPQMLNGTYLDNSFLYSALFHGLLALALLTVLYVWLGKDVEEHGDFFFALLIIMFLVRCLSESIMHDVVLNVGILAIGAMLAEAPRGAEDDAVTPGSSGSEAGHSLPRSLACVVAVPFALLALTLAVTRTASVLGLNAIPVRAAVDEYSWSELHSISLLMTAADNEQGAREIAVKYHLCNQDGSLDGTQTKRLALKDGTVANAQIIGLMHDTKTDGGIAGITFWLRDAPFEACMNSTDSNDGGWDACDIRASLREDMPQTLPNDLRMQLVEVAKATNNTGATHDAAAVSATADKLFLLSTVEIFGSQADDAARDVPYDAAINNAEGLQYPYFNGARTACPGIWLRSPSCFDDAKFACTDAEGRLGYREASVTLGPSFAFCL